MIDIIFIKKHIAIIKINRPEAANALSDKLLHEFSQAITEIDQNNKIYCTIITGSGDNSFCAGADLKERIKMSDKKTISTVLSIRELAQKIEQMKMPTIACLNGAAFGGGLELALACDIRIAADHVMMGLTETSLGIIPGAGGTQRLSRLIGLGQAKRLIYTASRINANEALQIGLLQEVLKKEHLIDLVLEIAESIASNGPIALKHAKIALNEGYETDLTTALEIEHLNYLQTIPTQDRKEGLKAFIEKRQPLFKGK